MCAICAEFVTFGQFLILPIKQRINAHWLTGILSEFYVLGPFLFCELIFSI